MSLAVYEWRKLFCLPALWAFLALSFLFNALLIGTLFGSPLLGIGLGTLLSMLGVGRVMAIWNRMVKQKLLKLAGLNP